MGDTAKPWTKVEVIDAQWRETEFGPQRPVSSSNCYLVRQGRIRYRWPGGQGQARAGQVCWVPAGMPFARQVVGGPVDRTTLYLRAGAWAPANEADAEALGLINRLNQYAYRDGPRLPLTGATLALFTTLLDELSALWQAPETPWHRSGLKAGAVRVLGLLLSDRRLRRAEAAVVAAPVRQAAERVDAAIHHLNQRTYIAQPELSVADLARLCGYRPSRFHALFLEATGSTPQRYLTERRVALACDLLARPDSRVLDVGFEVGFNSQSRFYQAFRAVMGIAPGRWRREQLAD